LDAADRDHAMRVNVRADGADVGAGGPGHGQQREDGPRRVRGPVGVLDASAAPTGPQMFAE
jgi:hypothetical protein